MRFILFCEGQTERLMSPFIKRWLDSKLTQKVRVHPVRFNGWRQMVDDVCVKADLWLNGNGSQDVIAVISLLDLYGPTIYPKNLTTSGERYDWLTKHMEGRCRQTRFRHYCAVHETEAWLLSQPSLFPHDVRPFIEKIREPEKVNNDKPPSKLLNELYLAKTGKKYKKTVNGQDLFSKLDPELATQKCPHLKAMLDHMVELGQAAIDAKCP
jgi:hypothetical protein